MKYRKKPVVVDAFKWTGDRWQEKDPEWIKDTIKRGIIFFDNVGTKNVEMRIETLEGALIVDRGNWIVREAKGEIHPVRDYIFRLTYEEAK